MIMYIFKLREFPELRTTCSSKKVSIAYSANSITHILLHACTLLLTSHYPYFSDPMDASNPTMPVLYERY